MYFKDETQRELLEKIHNGDIKAREIFLLMYYKRIKKIMNDLRIPCNLHEDILHDCIIALLEGIVDINTDNYEYIYGKIRACIIKQIAKSLEFFYDYKKEYNGKVYNKPSSYLSIVTKHNYNFYDIINEYIRYGTIKEEIIIEELSSDRIVEDVVIDDAIKDEYWKFVSNEPERKQRIIMGRFPIQDCYKENRGELAKEFGCSRHNIEQEENVIRARMARYSKFYQYLRK